MSKLDYVAFRGLAPMTFSSVSELYGDSEISEKLERKLQLLHCVVGIVTEVDELVDGIIKMDEINCKEEIGDMFWYIANYENTQGYSLGFIQSQTTRIDEDEIFRDLANHANDLLDLHKKAVFYNSDHKNDAIEVVFKRLKNVLIEFCNFKEWDIAGILYTNIAKLKQRYPDKFNTVDAVNRDLETERRILENTTK